MIQRVLVTGAGTETGAALLRSLAAMPDIEPYAADASPYAAGLYLVPPRQRLLTYALGRSDFIPHLLALCNGLCIDLLVPSQLGELLPLSRARDAFEHQGTRILLASEDVLLDCLDRQRLYCNCADIVNVPRAAVLHKNFDSASWEFPLLLVPRLSDTVFEMLPEHAFEPTVVYNASELARHHADGRYLAVEQPQGERYVVDLVCDRGGSPLAVVPMIELREPTGSYSATRSVRDETLCILARRIGKRLGITYAAQIEFARDADDRMVLVAVEPRLTEALPLAEASGVPSLQLCLREALGSLGSPASPPPLQLRERVMLRSPSGQLLVPDEVEQLENDHFSLSVAGQY